MHRQSEHLALDVPQRQVEGADGVGAFAARRIEEGAVHVLPEVLDELRIAADQAAGGGGEQVLGAAFADAGDAGIRLHGDDDVALVEQRGRIVRVICADPRDLHSRQGGEGGKSTGAGGNGCGRDRF